jgi:hypothetical protein
MKRHIVARIRETMSGDTLAERFEAAINNNWERGYRLSCWKLANEDTIIAVFTLRGEEDAG